MIGDSILMSTEVDAQLDKNSPDILVIVRGEPKIRLTRTAALNLSDRLKIAHEESLALPKPEKREQPPRRK
jgi:hypothetical protein